MDREQTKFEQQILKKFKKLLLRTRDVGKIDPQLHAYLVMIYGFHKETDIDKFRKEYEGVSGFRRFVIHFIKPAKDWQGASASLNKAVWQMAIDNVGECLMYCTKKEKLKKTA